MVGLHNYVSLPEGIHRIFYIFPKNRCVYWCFFLTDFLQVSGLANGQHIHGFHRLVFSPRSRERLPWLTCHCKLKTPPTVAKFLMIPCDILWPFGGIMLHHAHIMPTASYSPYSWQSKDTITGWCLSANHSEKYEFVSWDDIPNLWKVIKAMFQTTNQWLLTMVISYTYNQPSLPHTKPMFQTTNQYIISIPTMVHRY